MSTPEEWKAFHDIHIQVIARVLKRLTAVLRAFERTEVLDPGTTSNLRAAIAELGEIMVHKPQE
ncbi:MAG: hypothetical protein ACRENA_17175 [Vulcanimicrobiaceae bacterium]